MEFHKFKTKREYSQTLQGKSSMSAKERKCHLGRGSPSDDMIEMLP